MSEQVEIFANRVYTILFEEAPNIIIVKADGIPDVDTVSEAWWKALDLAEEKETRKWMADDYDLQLIHPEGTKWWVNVYLPEANRRLTFKGKRYTATVLPTRFYAEMSTRTVNHAMQDTINSKYYEQRVFQEPETALEWLRGVE